VKPRLAFIVGLIGVSLVWPELQRADTVDPDDDPALLHIGNGVGGSCPTGHEPGCPSHPNSSLSGLALSIYFNSNQPTTLSSPLVLILGLPDWGGPAPAIGSVLWYSSLSASGVPVPASLIGSRGQLTSGPAYQAAGYLGANSSNNFTNWSNAAQALLGLTPSFFALFAYKLDHDFSAGNLFDVSWDTALPLGTFAIAYGCDGGYTNNDPGASTVSCSGGTGNTYATPFTHAGMVTPEPATGVLMGAALASLALAIRRKSGAQRP
jgi:hypothetical protein